MLQGHVYHPAKEEKSVREVLTLSTQSIDLPEDDGMSLTGQIEMEEVDVVDAAPPKPFYVVDAAPPKPFYDLEEFEPECDLGSSPHTTVPDSQVSKYREEDLLTPPPLPPRNGNDITLKGENLFDPWHIGTTYVVLSKQNHGRFRFQMPIDPNKSAPPSPKPATPKPKDEIGGPIIAPVQVAPVSSEPPSAPRRALYQPKSISGSLVSLVPNNKHSDLDHTPSKLTSSPPRLRAHPPPQAVPGPPQAAPGPPLPARGSGKAMSPEQRRKFNRPQKEPAYREVAVDCGTSVPPVTTRKPSLQELQLEQKNPASREYHMQNIGERGSSDSSLPRSSNSSSLPRSQSPFLPSNSPYGPRSMSPHSQNTLRRSMPYVKLLGEEWKELAQRLGYENSQIASFSVDYPDPGQAMLDHWSRQPDSKLDDLLYHLKFMGLWKTADTIDKTFDKTNV